jgi:hypothetical protein
MAKPGAGHRDSVKFAARSNLPKNLHPPVDLRHARSSSRCAGNHAGDGASLTAIDGPFAEAREVIAG